MKTWFNVLINYRCIAHLSRQNASTDCDRHLHDADGHVFNDCKRWAGVYG